MPSLDISIFKWKCNFYHNNEKKWINGEIQLNQDKISIIYKDNDDKVKAKIIKYFRITKLSKEKSSYIYPSVVIYTSKDIVWVSSLDNRDETFNKLEHFWRQSLLDARANASSPDRNQELLTMAYETQGILLETSNKLHQQGRQIDSSARTLEKIHNDITVAERLTGDIESWFGVWRVKGRFANVESDTGRIAGPIAQQFIEYPVLYGKVAQESHKSGQVTLQDNNFKLLDEKYEVLHSFPVDKISEIDIHSPWDATIIKRSFGNPLIRIHLTSARMPVLLERLQQFKTPEFDLETLPQDSTIVDSVEELDSICGNVSGGQQGSASSEAQLQKYITDKDADELSKALKSMKHMATDIGLEQDAQLKQIDRMTDSVDRANTRLNKTNRRVDDKC